VCMCVSVCVFKVVKTEAAPGCPAYTQTVPSLNHLAAGSSFDDDDDDVCVCVCVWSDVKDTHTHTHTYTCRIIGFQSESGPISLCSIKTTFAIFITSNSHAHTHTHARTRTQTFFSHLFLINFYVSDLGHGHEYTDILQ